MRVRTHSRCHPEAHCPKECIHHVCPNFIQDSDYCESVALVDLLLRILKHISIKLAEITAKQVTLDRIIGVNLLQ